MPVILRVLLIAISVGCCATGHPAEKPTTSSTSTRWQMFNRLKNARGLNESGHADKFAERASRHTRRSWPRADAPACRGDGRFVQFRIPDRMASGFALFQHPTA
jgi:hypothetical protein